MFGPEGSRVVYGTYRPFNKPSLDYGAPIGPLIPRVRPVLIDGSQAVDITGYDVTQDWYRPRGVHSAANSLSKGLLNLTGRGFSGRFPNLNIYFLLNRKIFTTIKLHSAHPLY